MGDDRDDWRLRALTLVVLGVIVVVAIVAVTVVAVFTGRDLSNAVRLTFAGAVLVALVGGLSVYVERVRVRRRPPDDADD